MSSEETGEMEMKGPTGLITGEKEIKEPTHVSLNCMVVLINVDVSYQKTIYRWS